MLNKQQLHADFRIQMKPIQNLVFCQCLSQCLHFTCRKTLNYFTENKNIENFFWRSDKKQSSRNSNFIPQMMCLVISIHSAIISECSIFSSFWLYPSREHKLKADCATRLTFRIFLAIVHNSFNRRGPCVWCKPYESRSLCSNATIIGSFSKKKTLSVVRYTVQRK